jgi:Terminase large subunit, T4likevirus-type, N-terminal
MALVGRLKALERKAAVRRTNPLALAELARDRAAVLALARMPPDPWQRDLLRAKPHRGVVLCSRQSGKSLTAAADCVHTVLTQPGSLTLILSPTLRQSQELFRKCLALWRALGKPVGAESVSKTALELANGARVVACPGDPDGLVGFSNPALVVIDEAARAPDDLYFAVRPMLALGGRMLLTSTPFGPRGFFYSEWSDGGAGWDRVRVTAAECPRIAPAFLTDERRALGPKWFAQEYECSFESSAGAVFDHADILHACRVPAWLSA